MRAVGRDEVVDALRIEGVHLGHETGPAHGGGQHLIRNVAAEHVFAACFMDARIIGPESMSVPSRSKRTTG